MEKQSELKHRIETIVHNAPGELSVMVEINDEIVIKHNSQKVYSSASIIKIPIIMEAYRQSEDELIDLKQKIVIDDHQKVGGSGVISSLNEGTALSVKDILTLMIIVSDNSATNMMIDLLGQESINEFCKRIGCQKTVVERRLMDYEAWDKGLDNVTTAADMMLLLKELTNGHYLSKKSCNEILEIMSKQQFQDKLPAMMDVDKMFVANKTGEIPGVEHDVASIHYKNSKANVAVLMDGLESNYAGKNTIAEIGKAVYDYLLGIE